MPQKCIPELLERERSSTRSTLLFFRTHFLAFFLSLSTETSVTLFYIPVEVSTYFNNNFGALFA